MNWRRAWWGVLAVTLAVYAVMVMWTLPAITQNAGGLRPFDLRPMGYSSEEARAFLAALSPEGLELYTGPQKLLDLVYPPLLAVTLVTAVWMLFHNRRLRWVFSGLTVIAMLSDWTENLLVAQLLAGEISDARIAAASTTTVAKSGLTSVVFLGLVAGLAVRGARRFRRNAS